MIPVSKLESFLDGKIHFSDEEETEIKKWYEHSGYKLGKDLDIIDKKIQGKQYDNLDEEGGLYVQGQEILNIIKDPVKMKERKMKELGYRFGEDEKERQELLYKILFEKD